MKYEEILTEAPLKSLGYVVAMLALGLISAQPGTPSLYNLGQVPARATHQPTPLQHSHGLHRPNGLEVTHLQLVLLNLFGEL